MIVAGFGFRAGAGTESLRAAYEAAGGGADALAGPEDKAAGLDGLSAELGLPVRPVAETALEAQETLTDSAASRAARRTGSVAEASALAAAGPGARLLAPRAVSPDGMATCALAVAPPLGSPA